MGKKKGTTAFPVARIKKMMQADEDVGKIATLTPTLVGKALECMIEDVLTAAAAVTHDRRAKTIQPAHLREAIDAADKFDFLRGIVARVPLPDSNPGPAARAPRTPKTAKAEPGTDPKPLATTSKRPRSPPSNKTAVKSSPQLSKKPRGPTLVQASGQDCPRALACVSQATSVLPTSGVSAALPSTSLPALALPAIGDALNSGSMTKQSSLRSTCSNDNANDDDEDYDDEDGGDERTNEEDAESCSASGSAGSSANKAPAVVTPLKPATTTPDCGKRPDESVMQVSPMEETEEEDNSPVQRRYPKLVEPIDFAPAPRIFNPVPVTMKQNQPDAAFHQRPMLSPAGLGDGEAATFTMPNIPLAATKPGKRNDSTTERREEHKATRSKRVSVMSLLS